MKHLLLFLTILLLGCNDGNNFSISLVNYNLKGNVKLISEKIIPSLCDSNQVITADTAMSKRVIIRNHFFDTKGILLMFEYYDKDSVLMNKNEYIYSSSGDLKGSDIFSKGKLTEKVEIVKHSPELVQSNTVDAETHNINAETVTEYKNGLSFRHTTQDFVNKTVQKLEYKRDESGNEIEIVSSFKIDENEMVTVTGINYLEFDSLKNWTKRVEYNTKNNKGCRLILRKIVYY